MKNVTGGSFPARIWRDVMKAAHIGMPARSLPSPSGGQGFFEKLFGAIEDVKQDATKAIKNVEPAGEAPAFPPTSDRN